MPQAHPREVRAARAFLQKRGARTKDISPLKFANAAKELDIGFGELLAFISRLYAGGQNESQFRLDVIAKEATAAQLAAQAGTLKGG